MEIIKLNLIPTGITPSCHCSQYDNGRTIRVDLFNGFTPYVLQSGDTVTLNVRKPDNTIVVTSLTATQGNTYVNIETTEQMCACVGFNLCDLTIENGSKKIGTLNFIMQIERDVLADGIPSQSRIDDLEELVAEAVGDNYYTKTQVDDALAQKADSDNVYSKQQVDDALAQKASALEVSDIRLGVNGTLYPSAGDAVRGQVTDAHRENVSPFMNLINFGTLNYNKAINANGAPTTNNDYVATDYIDIGNSDFLLVNVGARYALYDENKTFISSSRLSDLDPFYGSLKTITTSGFNSTVKYIRHSILKTDLDNAFIIGLNQFVNFLGKNDTDLNIGYNFRSRRRLKPDGTTEADSNYFLLPPFDVQGLKTLYVKYGGRYAFYDNGGVLVSTDTISNTPKGWNDYAIISVPNNAATFRICCAYTACDPINYHVWGGEVVDLLLNINVVNNLKLYCIGDSITRGMYTDIGDTSSKGPTPYGYPYWVGKINGYSVVNLGESGGGYANKGTQTNSNGKDIVDANTFENADIVTIAFGVNDWKGDAQNIVLGSLASESGDGTVIGNMKYMIEKINEKAPTAQLIIMLPLNENRFSSGTEATNWGFGYAFRDGKTLEDYRQSIRECAAYYNLKVIDEEEVTPINRLNIRDVLGDGLHPTLAFYKQMGITLAPLIK